MPWTPWTLAATPSSPSARRRGAAAPSSRRTATARRRSASRSTGCRPAATPRGARSAARTWRSPRRPRPWACWEAAPGGSGASSTGSTRAAWRSGTRRSTRARRRPRPASSGMDLLRLGLERGRTADDAKRVITDLLERHGQGGSAQHGGRRFYHNSFIIADPATAWVLETSGRHWVARRVRGPGGDLEPRHDRRRLGRGVAGHRGPRGRAGAGGRREPAGASTSGPPSRTPSRATGRKPGTTPSCRFLAATGRPGVPEMLRHLRDHYDGGTVHRPGRKDGDPQGWSVCMHPEPAAGATAAAMVAELGGAGPVVAWCALTTPCTSVFLPVGRRTPSCPWRSRGARASRTRSPRGGS